MNAVLFQPLDHHAANVATIAKVITETNGVLVVLMGRGGLL